jgi:hypothetical protein
VATCVFLGGLGDSETANVLRTRPSPRSRSRRNLDVRVPFRENHGVSQEVYVVETFVTRTHKDQAFGRHVRGGGHSLGANRAFGLECRSSPGSRGTSADSDGAHRRAVCQDFGPSRSRARHNGCGAGAPAESAFGRTRCRQRTRSHTFSRTRESLASAWSAQEAGLWVQSGIGGCFAPGYGTGSHSRDRVRERAGSTPVFTDAARGRWPVDADLGTVSASSGDSIAPGSTSPGHRVLEQGARRGVTVSSVESVLKAPWQGRRRAALRSAAAPPA